jgi:hypothetical protein
MITIRPFPIVDLAGNIIKHIDIPCEVDAEIPGEDGILMTEDGSAAVRKARIELLKNTFWLVEYEARLSVVEVFPVANAKLLQARIEPSKASLSGRFDELGFFAPGQDTLWPLHHAKWIRQVHPTPPPAVQQAPDIWRESIASTLI